MTNSNKFDAFKGCFADQLSQILSAKCFKDEKQYEWLPKSFSCQEQEATLRKYVFIL